MTQKLSPRTVLKLAISPYPAKFIAKFFIKANRHYTLTILFGYHP
ncbi:unnamed protein product [Photorhabdus laumondii subsp. laumondii TTO1]|uniref:Photorhabdus luminescens subsp. laumondii TTO1 complete genome segment 11/17 n=1 Tax=Photorhabdus laumondii subsp. laumondii (strain DSM 15139 / CIP 105565 / TT01) TaxID=243265 RepID=Q7N2C5_PHOLL|nr:unnamed protein product [Photorhabdus laumondii subsp. laumondii TTO1]